MNLFTTIYTDRRIRRTSEMICSLLYNLYNSEISKIHLLIEKNPNDDIIETIKNANQNKENDEIRKLYNKKITIHKLKERPTFYDYTKIMQDLPYTINAIANTDIIFSSHYTKLIKDINWNDNLMLALAKWDIIDDTPSINFDTAVHFNRPDSQDAWIFNGRPKISNYANFTQGVAGCDNKFAYLMQEKGYHIANPSKDIKIYHYHISQARTYTSGNIIYRLEPPYKLLQPCSLSQIYAKI